MRCCAREKEKETAAAAGAAAAGEVAGSMAGRLMGEREMDGSQRTRADQPSIKSTSGTALPCDAAARTGHLLVRQAAAITSAAAATVAAQNAWLGHVPERR